MRGSPGMVAREGSPAFSISEVTTLGASFDEDLAAYRDAGADGIGVWEIKLPAGDDGAAAERLRASRLAPFEPTCCVCLTGPAGGRESREARRLVVEGLRRIGEAADEAGVRVGLE